MLCKTVVTRAIIACNSARRQSGAKIIACTRLHATNCMEQIAHVATTLDVQIHRTLPPHTSAGGLKLNYM